MKDRVRICTHLVLWFLVLSGFGAIAEETCLRRYPLPDHGGMQFMTPLAWQATVKQPPKRLPPTITFHPKTGKPFEILVTPLWSEKTETPKQDAAQVRQQVQQAADDIGAQAVEKTIAIIELKGASGTGYYFTATDRAPEPGGFKYLTQGMLPVGQLLVLFTILTNDGQQNITTAGLAMLSSATQTTTGTIIPITGEGWALECDTPMLSDRKESNKDGNFFFGASTDRFTISAFVEGPQGGKTNEDCYHFYWAKISRNPKITKDSVSISHTEKYYRVQYDLAIPFEDRTVTDRNVNYYFVFQNRWVDVHISVINPQKEDEVIFAAFDKSLTYGKTGAPTGSSSTATTRP